MKFFASCLCILLVGLGKPAPQQLSEPAESCGFALTGSPAKAVITGPEDIVPLVYVVEQPDSPVEILAVDFDGSFLSVANEQMTEALRCVITVHNRSDKRVKGFSTRVIAASRGGGPGTGFDAATSGTPELAPGQELQIKGCGGWGHDGVPGNHIRIFVYIGGAKLGDCYYEPSKRIPFTLGVWPVG